MSGNDDLEWEKAGENVYTAIEDDNLFIKIDISDEAKEKAEVSQKGEGKNKTVASTRGFTKVGRQISIGLNVISPK